MHFKNRATSVACFVIFVKCVVRLTLGSLWQTLPPKVPQRMMGKLLRSRPQVKNRQPPPAPLPVSETVSGFKSMLCFSFFLPFHFSRNEITDCSPPLTVDSGGVFLFLIVKLENICLLIVFGCSHSCSYFFLLSLIYSWISLFFFLYWPNAKMKWQNSLLFPWTRLQHPGLNVVCLFVYWWLLSVLWLFLVG